MPDRMPDIECQIECQIRMPDRTPDRMPDRNVMVGITQSKVILVVLRKGMGKELTVFSPVLIFEKPGVVSSYRWAIAAC